MAQILAVQVRHVHGSLRASDHIHAQGNGARPCGGVREALFWSTTGETYDGCGGSKSGRKRAGHGDDGLTEHTDPTDGPCSFRVLGIWQRRLLGIRVRSGKAQMTRDNSMTTRRIEVKQIKNTRHTLQNGLPQSKRIGRAVSTLRRTMARPQSQPSYSAREFIVKLRFTCLIIRRSKCETRMEVGRQNRVHVARGTLAEGQQRGL